MAEYLVRARPIDSGMAELRQRLEAGEVAELEPYGREMTRALLDARREESGQAVWEETCYCSPPLKMERAGVLDAYFTELTTEPIDQGAGWERIEPLPSLWAEVET